MRKGSRNLGLIPSKRYKILSPVAAPKAMAGASSCFSSIISRAIPPALKVKPLSDALVLFFLHVGPIMTLYTNLLGPYSISGPP